MTSGRCPRRSFLAAAASVAAIEAAPAPPSAPEDEIRLLVRADDIGSSHAANEACIAAYRDGIARSVEIMVPAPWFNEAVEMLKACPDLDVGIHLTLTSEWDSIKWGPVTQAPSLVDAQGNFYPTTSQGKDRPPNTGFLQAKPDLAEVERELRAQIELARARIPQVSHLSAHMGTPVATPELRAMVERLAAEYRLPLEAPAARPAGRWSGTDKDAAAKEAALVKLLEDLGPGTWIIVEHPGLDTPEMRAIGHRGYEGVARDRAGVTHAFTSARVNDVVARRGIRLVSYRDMQGR